MIFAVEIGEGWKAAEPGRGGPWELDGHADTTNCVPHPEPAWWHTGGNHEGISTSLLKSSSCLYYVLRNSIF